MIALMFGPPGSGKGTQAEYLSHKYQVPAISTGDIFRAECAAETEIGKRVTAIMKSGGFVTDDLTNAVVANRIAQPDCAGGFLLDGYPRTVPQAQFLSTLFNERGLPLPIVIHLDVPDDALVARLSARRQCPRCRRIYNLRSRPPIFRGLCDRDGFGLIMRQDDQVEVILERLKTYNELTNPVLSWFGPKCTKKGLRGCVYKVDGTQSPEDVRDAIEAILDKLEQQHSSAPA